MGIKELFTPTHLIVLLVIVLILFGSAKLPALARNLGKSARIVKSEIDEIKTEAKAGASETVDGETVTTAKSEPTAVKGETTEPKA